MRARYVHRITRDDVGSRVSIRRWVDDPDRGQVPSDVVGRLTAWSDDDTLTVTKRDGTHITFDATTILASRTIPTHPHVPPEPTS